MLDPMLERRIGSDGIASADQTCLRHVVLDEGWLKSDASPTSMDSSELFRAVVSVEEATAPNRARAERDRLRTV